MPWLCCEQHRKEVLGHICLFGWGSSFHLTKSGKHRNFYWPHYVNGITLSQKGFSRFHLVHKIQALRLLLMLSSGKFSGQNTNRNCKRESIADKVQTLLPSFPILASVGVCSYCCNYGQPSPFRFLSVHFYWIAPAQKHRKGIFWWDHLNKIFWVSAFS